MTFERHMAFVVLVFVALGGSVIHGQELGKHFAVKMGQADASNSANADQEGDSSKPLLTLEDHSGPVGCVAFSPDGKWLATGGSDWVIVRNAATGQPSRSLKGQVHFGAILGLAFSHDGKRLASTTPDGVIRVWEPATGRLSLTLKGHTSQVLSVAFSPDGKWLATGSADKTVKVWEAATGQEFLTQNEHITAIRSVAYSPDGKHLVSVSEDAAIKLWDAATGRESHQMNGHRGSIESVAFSPDGEWLATASADMTVKVWDTAKRKQMLTLNRHTGGVRSVAFSPHFSPRRIRGPNFAAVVVLEATGFGLVVERGFCGRQASSTWSSVTQVREFLPRRRFGRLCERRAAHTANRSDGC